MKHMWAKSMNQTEMHIKYKLQLQSWQIQYKTQKYYNISINAFPYF